MKKIKIIGKSQGVSPLNLFDNLWQKVLKLDNGTFHETSSQITFKTTDDEELLILWKDGVLEENDQIITYRGAMIHGPALKVDKIKSEKDRYVFRTYFPGPGFFVGLTAE